MSASRMLTHICIGYRLEVRTTLQPHQRETGTRVVRSVASTAQSVVVLDHHETVTLWRIGQHYPGPMTRARTFCLSAAGGADPCFARFSAPNGQLVVEKGGVVLLLTEPEWEGLRDALRVIAADDLQVPRH